MTPFEKKLTKVFAVLVIVVLLTSLLPIFSKVSTETVVTPGELGFGIRKQTKVERVNFWKYIK